MSYVVTKKNSLAIATSLNRWDWRGKVLYQDRIETTGFEVHTRDAVLVTESK
jgi:hypothetical protein